MPTALTVNGPTATHNCHTTCTTSLQEILTVRIPRKTTTLRITNAPVPGIQESFPSKPISIDVRDVWSWPLKWLLPVANLPWNRPNSPRKGWEIPRRKAQPIHVWPIFHCHAFVGQIQVCKTPRTGHQDRFFWRNSSPNSLKVLREIRSPVRIPGPLCPIPRPLCQMTVLLGPE